jgi:hypothetical protein
LPPEFFVFDRQFAVRARSLEEEFESGQIDRLFEEPESVQLVDGSSVEESPEL